jgi:hypothetical protein
MKKTSVLVLLSLSIVIALGGLADARGGRAHSGNGLSAGGSGFRVSHVGSGFRGYGYGGYWGYTYYYGFGCYAVGPYGPVNICPY